VPYPAADKANWVGVAATADEADIEAPVAVDGINAGAANNAMLAIARVVRFMSRSLILGLLNVIE
jgi:hypothetical protein